MAHLVRNEQLKLRANLFNTVAGASAVAGIITPFSNMLFNGGYANFSLRTGVYALFWLTGSLMLHGLGWTTLKGLREEE